MHCAPGSAGTLLRVLASLPGHAPLSLPSSPSAAAMMRHGAAEPDRFRQFTGTRLTLALRHMGSPPGMLRTRRMFREFEERKARSRIMGVRDLLAVKAGEVGVSQRPTE